MSMLLLVRGGSRSSTACMEPEAQELADVLHGSLGSVLIEEEVMERSPLTRQDFIFNMLKAAGWPVYRQNDPIHNDIRIKRGRLDVTTARNNTVLVYTWLV